MMTKPKLKIKPGFIDYLFEVTSIALLVLIIVTTIISYSDLPESIPIHFSLNGTANAYGSKLNVWLFPLIATLAFVGLTIIVRYPHLFNYPVQITENNAEKNYKIGIRVMSLVKVLFLALLLCIILLKVL